MKASTDSCSSSIRRSGYLPLSFTRTIRYGHRSGLSRGEASGWFFVGRVTRRRLLPARFHRLICPLLTSPPCRPRSRSAQSPQRAGTVTGISRGAPMICSHTSTGSTFLAIRQIEDFFLRCGVVPALVRLNRFLFVTPCVCDTRFPRAASFGTSVAGRTLPVAIPFASVRLGLRLELDICV